MNCNYNERFINANMTVILICVNPLTKCKNIGVREKTFH